MRNDFLVAEDYPGETAVRILSTLLERRVVEQAAREADLDFIDRVLRAKRGTRR